MAFFKTNKEKILDEKIKFESWAISSFPLIQKIFDFDYNSLSYKEEVVKHL